MYEGRSVSVVMPAYNEEDSIADAVAGFAALEPVDEVLVVDNNSTDRSAKLAMQAGAVVVKERSQGYGHASRAALLAASGELVAIVEPDGTFIPEDLHKLLAYSGQFDAVIGTRTSRGCIHEGANMGPFLRHGNVAVGKLLEYLHGGPRFTDVGCTFKLIHKPALEDIANHLTVGGSHFSPQLMMALVRTGKRCVEIPVNYRVRRGQSKITGSFWKAFKLGMRMIFMIIGYRFKSFPRSTPAVRQDPADRRSTDADAA